MINKTSNRVEIANVMVRVGHSKRDKCKKKMGSLILRHIRKKKMLRMCVIPIVILIGHEFALIAEVLSARLLLLSCRFSSLDTLESDLCV